MAEKGAFGPGRISRKLKNLEKQQTTMEADMSTAKDMIWRLSNRVITLEQEVKYLKTYIFKDSNKNIKSSSDNCSTERNSNVSFTDIAIARRRSNRSTSNSKKFSDAKVDPSSKFPTYDENESGSNASMSAEGFLDGDFINMDEIDVKELIVESEVGNISSITTTKPAKHRRNSDSDTSFLYNSDNNSDSDYSPKAKIRVKPLDKLRAQEFGSKPHRSTIWKHFDVQTIDTSEVGGKVRTVTTCKFCKHQVSARSDRLRSHVQKCVIPKLKDTSKESTSSTVNDKSIDLDETVASINDNENEEEDSSMVEENKSKVVLKKENACDSSVASGRKLLPTWQHFDTKMIVESKNGVEVKVKAAFCKSCGKQVSPRSYRLVNHLKNCPGVKS